MKSSLLGNLFLLFLLSPYLLGCPAGLKAGGSQNCSQYSYNDQTRSWVDALGNPVSCSIADNKKIFPYLPESGCDHWRETFQADPTVKFVEIPIAVGSGQGILQTYCVKQRYISIDSSGQVLLIDEGHFCLRENKDREKEYFMASCAGVYRKRQDPASANQTISEPTPKSTGS